MVARGGSDVFSSRGVSESIFIAPAHRTLPPGGAAQAAAQHGGRLLEISGSPEIARFQHPLVGGVVYVSLLETILARIRVQI